MACSRWYINMRILNPGSQAQHKGIPETMACRTLTFRWSFAPEVRVRLSSVNCSLTIGYSQNQDHPTTLPENPKCYQTRTTRLLIEVPWEVCSCHIGGLWRYDCCHSRKVIFMDTKIRSLYPMHNCRTVNMSGKRKGRGSYVSTLSRQ